MVRGSTFVRPGAVFAAAFVLGLTASCSKIVGIGDTNVESNAGAEATSGGSSGRGGAAGNPSTGSGGTAGAATGSGGMSAGGKGGTGAQTGGGTGGSGATGDGGAGGTGGGSGGSGGASAGGGTGGSLPMAGSGGASATGGTGGTDSAGGEGGSTPTTCPAQCPLDKPSCIDGACGVRGPKLIDAGSYFIDATEVTVGEYKAFTDARGNDTSGQAGACSWNTDFKPAGDPGTDPNLPVSYVDWCDAAAFCKWADEHLCGAIDGSALTKDELFDANLSQWFQACGAGGSHPRNNAVCNSVNGNGDAVPVGSLPDCEGYYPGLFDMEGNVAEWVDVCDANTGESDVCHALGGSMVDGQSFCSEDYDYFLRTETAFTIGFRCCSG